ncbi:MAG: hypothetical protein R2822_28115 [Spirosomataceae bacterium]
MKPNEGGIATPLIVHYPQKFKIQQNKLTNQIGHLIDIMPTILEVSGTAYPTTFHNGQPIPPLEGKAL